jgi:hypothetical protein
MNRYRGPYMASKSGGPCWSRDRGYHHPAPTPAHIQRMLLSPAPKPLPPADATRSVVTETGGELGPGNASHPPEKDRE